MAISKALIASILISLLVLQLAEADQLIVEEHVLLDAVYRLGRTSARGHAGVAAPAAAAFLQELPVIVRSAPATPT
ncbi:hypothetical protein CJ030_MR8G002774 [Morella rubra]|uniref:Uncharacterized protein n=1 Tax=Morella rubra TaxID=262757 RepID=A0A6A1UX57_9ROSI|nr:hypothetical protein CJ030_MR8G002774 [Morella rubra]